MASGVSQPPSPPRPAEGRTLTCEQFIEGQLRKTSNGVKLVDLAFALMLLVAATLGFFGLMALLDHWVVPGGLSTWARAACFVFFFGGAIAYVALRVVPILLGRINPVYAAYTIEHSAPALKNSLLNFLLFRSRQRGEVSEPVYQALEQQAAAKLSKVPVELAVDRSKILYVGYVLMALAVVCALYKVLSPKDPIVTAQRVLLPWADILPPSRVKIEEIKPGSASAVRGEVVQVSARIKGLGAQEAVQLVYTTDDGQAVDRALPMVAADGGDVFTCGLPESEAGLQEALTYRIEAGDAVSHLHRIDVITAPTIALKTVFLQFPEYTKLLDRRYVRDGNLRAIEGTKVSLRVETNTEIKTAWVDFENDKQRDLEMTHKGTEAWVTFALEMDAERRAAKHSSYSLRFTNTEGRSNHDPVEYRIEVKPDLAPEIAFLQPEPSERETEVPLDGLLTIETSSLDPDFALAKVELHGKVGEKEVFLRPLLEKLHSGQFVTKYELSPKAEKLKAGDVVDYWAVAIDNKTPDPNRTQTELYRFKVTVPERPEDDQLAQNNPRNKPEENPNAKPDDKNDGQPMEDKENPAEGKKDPAKKQDPGKKNPDQKSEEQDPEQVNQEEQQQEDQGDQQGDPQSGDQSQSGDKQESGEDSGDSKSKQKSKDKSKEKPKPGEKGQDGGDGEGSSAGEPGEEGSDSEEPKHEGAKGGKPTGKKSDTKPKSSDSDPNDAETSEGDTSEGEPGAVGSKSGQKSPKPSEDSELADQNQSQKPDEVAKDDEGTVFDRLKKALEEKQKNQSQKGQDSPADTAQKKPEQKQEDQVAQGGDKSEPKKQQGDSQAGDQSMPPDEDPTDASDSGDKPTGQQGKKPESKKSDREKSDGEKSGESQTGEKKTDDQNSEQNGTGEGKEDPLFEPEKGAGKKSEQKSEGAGKEPSPDKQPMAGDDPMSGTGEKPEPKSGAGADKKVGEQPGKEKGQKPGEEPAKKPGEEPAASGNEDNSGEKQSEGGTKAKQGTPKKEQPDKQGEKSGEEGDSKQKPTEGENAQGNGGAGSNSKDKQEPTPDAQTKTKAKDRPTKEPGKEDEKKSDEGKSPGHGKSQSDSQGQQDGDKKGGGKEGGGDKAPLPGTGSPGENSASDQGTGKANDAGPMGETSDMGGDKEPAKQPPKTPGESKAGEGRKKEANDQTPGKEKPGDGNKPGEQKSQPSDNKQPGKPGEGKNNNAPPTDGDGQPLGGDGTREGQAAPSKQGEAPLADDPNLEYSRKATDLVLDYLENQLKQDELSREVQEQLPGWTKDDIQQLVDRARTREEAAKGGPESSAAKKEFEDWLRSLGLKKNSGRGVTQQSGAKDDTQSGLRQTRGAKAPAEYADQVEAYKKGLSREGGKGE